MRVAGIKAGSLRLLLVDDHTLFRESLRRLLEAEPDLQVCGDFSTAADALAAVRGGLEFDLALLDYELSLRVGGGTGLDMARRLRSLLPEVPVLMVTAGMDNTELLQAVQELQAGVFLKTEPTAELLLAIQRTARGEQWISSRAALALVASHGAAGRKPDMLTQREFQVLRGVLEGRSNKEIAAAMDLSESAVKAVLQKLFEKTGVRSRSQLVRYAIETQTVP